MVLEEFAESPELLISFLLQDVMMAATNNTWPALLREIVVFIN
jgi:hypothetical protein